MSEWIQRHVSCDECGSSDGRSVNDKGWSTCFVCDHKFKEGGTTMAKPNVILDMVSNVGIRRNTTARLDKVPTNAAGMEDRGITPATCRKFGVAVDGVDAHVYPYFKADNKADPEAVKIRFPNKEFRVEGAINECMLFGQQLFPGDGRNIVITEGETDAMAVYQLQGSKYPSVSVTSSGSALKDCKRNYEYLDSFESVMICMDNDDAGRKAEKQLAELFSGKSKVMYLADYGDPVDMLRDGAKGRDAWKTAFFGAAVYTPEGVIAGTSLWDAVSKPMKKSPLSFPWPGLNEKTYGIFMPSLITLTAGSGSGKSQMLREMVDHVLKTSDEKVGLMFLEESAAHTALSMMALDVSVPINLPGHTITDDLRKQAYDNTIGSGRVFLSNSDHFGNATIDGVLSKIRYFNKVQGCRVVCLDHLQMVASGKGDDNERVVIDETMTKLRTIAQELEIAIFVISHLKRPRGAGHEEGGRINLSHLRGSGSIGHLSDLVIGAERNGQSDDNYEANIVKVRVVKNRKSGDLGLCCSLHFDKKTGRMTEVDHISTSSVTKLEEGL